MKGAVKIAAIYFLRIFMRLLYIFPIKNNRIIINAYRGLQYSCNPKYISEYLTAHYGNQLEIIWAFRKPDNYRFLEKQGIRLIKYNSFQRLYYEATAKISLNNIGSFSWLPVRKNQEHINTWHGGFGYKRVGLGEVTNGSLIKKSIRMSSDETTLVAASCAEFSADLIRTDLGYKGPIMASGFARNDIIYQQKCAYYPIRAQVLSSIGITGNPYVVLYAPTWRYNAYEKVETPYFEKLKKVLMVKGCQDVIVLSRMHHITQVNWSDSANVIDVSDYPDMQELLCITDCLITDYSSCIWDFSITGKPIYLFAPDIEEYRNGRGYHVDIYDWHFPVARNNQELFALIASWTEAAAVQAAIDHHQAAGSYEKGTACEQVGEWINNICTKLNEGDF